MKRKQNHTYPLEMGEVKAFGIHSKVETRLTNQQLEAVNQSLAEQTQEPFLHYCMKAFIQNAKTRGEHGEVKHMRDGFQIYMERNYQRLRDSWEQQFCPAPQEEERFHEREYEQAPEYDDRER